MRRMSTDRAAAAPALLVAERRQAALQLRDRPVDGGQVLGRARRQRPVELGERPRGRQLLGALDQRPLELAAQVALEAVDLLAVERRLVSLGSAPAAPGGRGCGGSAARRPRSRPSPRRGGRRRRSRAAPGRASRRRGPRRSPGGPPRAARRGRGARRRRSGAPRRSPARAPPPRRRGRRSGRRAARRRAGPPGTWRSSRPAPRGSRPARSQGTVSQRRERVEDLRGPDRDALAPQLLAERDEPRREARGQAVSRRPRHPSRAPPSFMPDALGDQVHVGAVLDDDAHRPLEHGARRGRRRRAAAARAPSRSTRRSMAAS